MNRRSWGTIYHPYSISEKRTVWIRNHGPRFENLCPWRLRTQLLLRIGSASCLRVINMRSAEMSRKVYHVVLRKEAWHVRRTRARRSSGCHSRKAGALAGTSVPASGGRESLILQRARSRVLRALSSHRMSVSDLRERAHRAERLQTAYSSSLAGCEARPSGVVSFTIGHISPCDHHPTCLAGSRRTFANRRGFADRSLCLTVRRRLAKTSLLPVL